MKKKKVRFTWYYVLIGIVIFALSYFNLTDKSDEPTLHNIDVQLRSDMERIPRSKNHADYKFYTENENVRFIILNGALNNDQKENVAKLKKEALLTISIDALDVGKLNSETHEVIVYEIMHNDTILLSFEDFKNNRNKYSIRINILFMFFALLSILKGIHISDKVRTIIFFGAIVLFIVVRILNIGF